MDGTGNQVSGTGQGKIAVKRWSNIGTHRWGFVPVIYIMNDVMATCLSGEKDSEDRAAVRLWNNSGVSSAVLAAPCAAPVPFAPLFDALPFDAPSTPDAPSYPGGSRSLVPLL